MWPLCLSERQTTLCLCAITAATLLANGIIRCSHSILLNKFGSIDQQPLYSVASIYEYRYGWEVHDGRNFGVHEVVEPGVEVRVEWVKRSVGEWSARIVARPGVRAASALAAASSAGQQSGHGGSLVSLMFYVHARNEHVGYELDPSGNPVVAHGTLCIGVHPKFSYTVLF